MKTLEEIKEEIGKITILIYEAIPVYLKTVIDDLASEDRDFKELVKNKVTADSLFDLNESLITETTELDIVAVMAEDVSEFLDKMISLILVIGGAAHISREAKMTTANLVILLQKSYKQLQNLKLIADESFLSWIEDQCILEPPPEDNKGKFTTFTGAKTLWENYLSFIAKVPQKTRIQNTKQFAHVLRAFGLKPGVTEINDKTTRVYYGISLKETEKESHT